VQFEGGDSYQGTPSGVSQKPPLMPALAAVMARASGWSRWASDSFCGHRWTVCWKTQLVEGKRRRGLKPRLIFNGLRGPKGPLFHGSTDKSEFFSKLW